ncbi:DinB family protein [Saccharothrix obliqua]|uniref:DinB family protein n=1 Tax=Saccharothrix obliqua TaxID=2861747 RepID=UPI001C5DE3F2|nr:DinB family protein [Saccharothrix obliqua]MBW4720107.1 DinB family protein [Saccharothrix obliqua]
MTSPGTTPTIVTSPEDRVEVPFRGDERTLLCAFLDYLRGTVELKVAGLSDEDAHRPVLPSPLTTAAGVVKHLRWVENYWFRVALLGHPDEAPYSREDPDGDWRILPGETISGLVADYASQCAVSRDVVAGLDLDHEVPFRGDRRLSARWVLIHMIEETGRHAGHLDVVRELLDGVTGE